MTQLKHKRVAILSTDGFEETELTSPKAGTIKGWKNGDWSIDIKVDKILNDADTSGYDALVLPGGVMNPDKLRLEKDAVAFVSRFLEQGKPVAAICHDTQTLIETGMLKGRKMTSFPSLKTDLEHAGASWADREVVVDKGLVTSRTPDDLPAFNKKMIEAIAEGIHRDKDA